MDRTVAGDGAACGRALGAEEPASLNGTSADAVAKATGHRWGHWLRTLDADGAADMCHRDIARHLVDRHALSGWWAQQVTVGYEKARGRRAQHQRPDGFEISVSKTAPIAAAELRERVRARLPEWELAERRAEDRWIGVTARVGRVRFDFQPKGDTKATVVVTHSRLPDRVTAEDAKVVWRSRLTELLEGPGSAPR